MTEPRVGDVALLEDDAYFAEALSGNIRDLGGKCRCAGSVKAAESWLSGRAPKYLIADLAVPLGRARCVSNLEGRAGHTGGLAFVRRARLKWKNTKYVIISGVLNAETMAWCTANNVTYKIKPIDKAFLEMYFGLRRKRAFVVHGRNKRHIIKLKGILRTLKIDPIILMEQPSKGRTVIEKFETVSEQCDIAIVALSDDDIGRLAATGMKSRSRARQNVIFELGYFFGALKRTSGRVVLVDFGVDEMPSDIAGIVRVDGTANTRALLKEIRGEV